MKAYWLKLLATDDEPTRNWAVALLASRARRRRRFIRS